MSIEQLSERERACLRLLLHPMRAKEIAHRLGLSTYTVNDHLKSARRKLGVQDSLSAAHMLRAHESGHPEKIEPNESGWPTAEGRRQDGDGKGLQDQAVMGPFAVKGRPWNDLSVSWRLLWPLLLFGLIALGAGILLGGIASLSQLLLSLSR